MIGKKAALGEMKVKKAAEPDEIVREIVTSLNDFGTNMFT